MGTPQSIVICIGQVVAFYIDLLLLQKAVSLMRGESDMRLWVQGCIFRMQLEVALT